MGSYTQHLSFRIAAATFEQRDTFTSTNLGLAHNPDLAELNSNPRQLKEERIVGSKHSFEELENAVDTARDFINLSRLVHEQLAAAFVASDPRRKNADL